MAPRHLGRVENSGEANSGDRKVFDVIGSHPQRAK
jgi:hypothetical protein